MGGVTGSILCTREAAIATVTLANPGKRNALDLAMWRTLAAVLSELSGDEQVRCVVLRGDGEQAFAAGGDIDEFLSQRDTLERAMAYHEQAGAALQAVFDCRHPTIALVQGACIGGGLEIAAQCDLRICGESARFGAPINKLGFSMYPVVARWHKQWVRRLQHDRPLGEQELRASFAFLDSEDYREGLSAFREKRKPQFTGR